MSVDVNASLTDCLQSMGVSVVSPLELPDGNLAHYVRISNKATLFLAGDIPGDDWESVAMAHALGIHMAATIHGDGDVNVYIRADRGEKINCEYVCISNLPVNLCGICGQKETCRELAAREAMGIDANPSPASGSTPS